MQSAGQNMLEHGVSVHRHYKEIQKSWEQGSMDSLGNLGIDWGFFIKGSWDEATLRRYHIWHDIGKSACRQEIDGRVHYPNHAAVSRELYESIFVGDSVVARLIGQDMMLHTFSVEQMQEWLESNKLAPDFKRDACTLVITAWAEINSNSQMWGGRESVGYKIKKKKLMRLTKLVHTFLMDQKA